VTTDSHGNKIKTANGLANKTTLRFRSQEPSTTVGAQRESIPKGNQIPNGITTPMSVISGNTVINNSSNNRYSSNNSRKGNSERQE